MLDRAMCDPAGFDLGGVLGTVDDDVQDSVAKIHGEVKGGAGCVLAVALRGPVRASGRAGARG